MSNVNLTDQKSFLLAIFAVFFWSTVATAFKLTLEYIDPYYLLALSSFVSLIILFVTLIIKNKISVLLHQTYREWIISVFLGLLNPFLYYLILFNAYNILPAQEAMVLNYSWPILLSFFSSIFFKRKIKFLGYLALSISFFGIVIIATKGNFLSIEFKSTFGIILALGSAFVWALFWILNMVDKREPLLKLTSGFIFGAFFSILFVLIRSDFQILTKSGILGSIYIGTFEMGLTFILWLTALNNSKQTEKISQLVYLSPFLSLIFISIILKEEIILSSVIGLILIILGIVVQSKVK